MNRLEKMVADAILEIIDAALKTDTEEELYDVFREFDLTFYDDDCSIVHTDVLLDVLNDYFNFGFMLPEQLNVLLPNVCNVLGLKYERHDPQEDDDNVTEYLVYLFGHHE